MPINFIDRNNRTVSLQEFDSTDHLNEVGIPISSAIVGSVKFEIKGSAGYIDSNGRFNSPTGYVKITQGNTQKYYDITAGRGITLFVFSGDLHLRERVQYDTFANGNSGLISKLQTINNNFIYILASADAHPMNNDLKNCLNAQFGCNITTTYDNSRRGFALIYASRVCAFQFSNSKDNANAYTILTRYLGFINFNCVRNLLTEQANSYSFSIHNGITYDSNKTYKIRVRFRTRGDGNSTSSKCSSVGFITWNADWSKKYGYIHSPNQAYSERGKIVDWTFTFRTSSDYIAANSAIFYIINNDWANGYDNQTIDLYYYKFWSIDSSGKETKISEAGNGAIKGRYGNVSYNTHSLPSQRVINFIKNNKLYYSVLCSTILDTSYGSQSYRNTEPYNKRIATINYSTSTYGTFNANLDGNRHLGLVSLTKSYASNNQQVYKRTITYNGNGGSVNPSSYSNYFKTSNPSITVNSSASRAYYSLVRWNSKQDNTGTAYNNGTAYNFGSDTTLYAIWKALAYSITYNLNGGTNSSSNPTSYTVESNTITFANPTRPYYTFQGWTLSSIPKGSNGNKSTTANWKRTYALYSASSSVSESVSGSGWRTHTLQVTFAFSLLENGVNSNAEPSNFSLSWDMPNTYGLAITKSDKIVYSNLGHKVYTLTVSAHGGNAGAGSLLVTGQLKDMKNNVVIGSFRFYTSSDWYKSSSGGGSSGGGGSGGGRE